MDNVRKTWWMTIFSWWSCASQSTAHALMLVFCVFFLHTQCFYPDSVIMNLSWEYETCRCSVKMRCAVCVCVLLHCLTSITHTHVVMLVFCVFFSTHSVFIHTVWLWICPENMTGVLLWRWDGLCVFVCSSLLFDVYHTHTRCDVGLLQGFCKSSEHHWFLCVFFQDSSSELSVCIDRVINICYASTLRLYTSWS